MATYRSLLAMREFRTLWLSQALSSVAATMFSLALATTVHRQTGSALLTALSMFGPSLAQVLGAVTLMSAADAAPPRRTLVGLASVSGATYVAQAALPLPTSLRIVLVLGAAYVLSIGSGVRWGLLRQVLPTDGYALGRSLMNISVGVTQVLGFALAGLLLQRLSAREIFVAAAVVASSVVPVLRLGIGDRPARRAARAGLRETWRGNRLLLRTPSTRPLLVALCVPNGLVVGIEALFVPYAGDGAAWLFGAGAAGMLAGDVVVGRLLTAPQRRRAAAWLRLVLAAPFLLYVAALPLWLAALLAAIGSVGYAASLAQQEMLVSLTADDLAGQALGAESAARMTCQGLGALLAGGLADVIDVGAAISLLAASSLVVSLALSRPLARAACRATARV